VGDVPTEAPTPRNVTMYLNYHYVCKLPAAGVVVAFKSSQVRGSEGNWSGNGKDRHRSSGISRDLEWGYGCCLHLSGVGVEPGHYLGDGWR
jgi:hypothetical protein